MNKKEKCPKAAFLSPATIFMIFAGIICLLPLFFGMTKQSDYLLYVVVRIMILAIYAVSFDLLHGVTGIFSFGHASLLGSGAYAAAILVTRSHISEVAILIGASIIIGALLSLAMGILSSRVGGLAVFLITFAFVEVVRLFAISDPLSITNGDNGLAGVTRGYFFGFLNLKTEFYFYYFTLFFLGVTFFAIYWIKDSPLGDVFFAIRENSDRVPFLGYDLRAFKTISFFLSGIFAGLAGCLMALHESSVSPDILHWFLSADALFYVILGGRGTLIGPVLATSLMVVIQEILSDIITRWPIFMGMSLIALIFFLPKGLYPFIEKRFLGKKEYS